jgi:hypothetical protein
MSVKGSISAVYLNTIYEQRLVPINQYETTKSSSNELTYVITASPRVVQLFYMISGYLHESIKSQYMFVWTDLHNLIKKKRI